MKTNIFWKKSVSLLLTVFVLFHLTSSITVSANVNIKIGKYSELLGKRGLSGKFKIKDLYNSNDIKQWKLFYSDNSYLILNPESNEVLEYGTDSGDPYFEYSDSKYYYGGPLQYYVKNKKINFITLLEIKKSRKL